MASSDALPIDPTAFARALESLPTETLHLKAAEIQNSIAHLKTSNAEMLPFADEGDADCREAMFENLVVIGRMNERIQILRDEVERRGLRWADAEVEDAERKINGHVLEEGDVQVVSRAEGQSGRLTDEELRRRLEEQLAGEEEEEGVHLTYVELGQRPSPEDEFKSGSRPLNGQLLEARNGTSLDPTGHHVNLWASEHA
ncbi:hypothetical protein ANO11243_057310 [Dothideomycetidae sp. 11243]|nr:hypothetical protein ANO11243_057310 [fungal sp. No.11243]